jgi:hypothetical protein
MTRIRFVAVLVLALAVAVGGLGFVSSHAAAASAGIRAYLQNPPTSINGIDIFSTSNVQLGGTRRALAVQLSGDVVKFTEKNGGAVPHQFVLVVSTIVGLSYSQGILTLLVADGPLASESPGIHSYLQNIPALPNQLAIHPTSGGTVGSSLSSSVVFGATLSNDIVKFTRKQNIANPEHLVLITSGIIGLRLEPNTANGRILHIFVSKEPPSP